MITLTQGMNRQIRRMCKALGYRVTNLQRLRIESLLLDDLSLNQMHQLIPDEINELQARLNKNTNR